MANTFIEHKQHRHHDKCHMVVPGAPFAQRYLGFVLRPRRPGGQKEETVGLAGNPVSYVNKNSQGPDFQQSTGGIAELQYGLLTKAHALHNRLCLMTDSSVR